MYFRVGTRTYASGISRNGWDHGQSTQFGMPKFTRLFLSISFFLPLSVISGRTDSKRAYDERRNINGHISTTQRFRTCSYIRMTNNYYRTAEFLACDYLKPGNYRGRYWFLHWRNGSSGQWHLKFYYMFDIVKKHFIYSESIKHQIFDHSINETQLSDIINWYEIPFRRRKMTVII